MNEHIRRLLAVIDAFLEAEPLKETTLSFRIFNDSKTISLLRNGADITTGRMQSAIEWMSDRWPSDARWPIGVARPRPNSEAA